MVKHSFVIYLLQAIGQSSISHFEIILQKIKQEAVSIDVIALQRGQGRLDVRTRLDEAADRGQLVQV